MIEQDKIKERLKKLSWVETQRVIDATQIYPVWGCAIERMGRWRDTVADYITTEELNNILIAN